MSRKIASRTPQSRMNILEYKGTKVVYRADVNPSLFISGFKGFGMVGYLSTLYIVEILNCKTAGYIISKYIPDAVSVDEKGDIIAPFTLYQCFENSREFLVLVNHDLPYIYERARFMETIARFLLKVGIQESILIGGFDSRFKQGDETLRWLATSHYQRNLSEPKMEPGLYVIGPLALMLLAFEINGIPAVVILPYAEADRPDPRAASIAIMKINELYNLSIPVEELLERAKKFEEMIVEIERRQKEAYSLSHAERSYM